MCLDFWDLGFEVFKSFPFQKEALDFAHWANHVPPGELLKLLTSPTPDFPHFRDRWAHVSGLMAAVPMEPPGVQASWAQDQGPHMGAWLAANNALAPKQVVRVFVQEYKPVRRYYQHQAGAASCFGSNSSHTRRFVVATYRSLWNQYVWCC